MTKEIKVGVFIILCLVVLAWATFNVRDLMFFERAGYETKVRFSSAQGIRPKTPVEVAGIEVGYVKGIRLLNSKIAEITLYIHKDVSLPEDSRVYVKTRGFLGETYLEIVPGVAGDPVRPGEVLAEGPSPGDLSTLTGQMSAIAVDMKAITAALRQNVEGDESRFNRTLANIETITANLAAFTENNATHFDEIASNLAVLTQDLKSMVEQNRVNIDDTLGRIANVTQKIDEGRGTLGKLVNDDATVEKLNDSLDSLNDTLGGISKLKTEIGYRTEYLAQAGDLKHYVNLAIKPRPDKYFLVALVSDPSPAPNESTEVRTVTSGGTTSTVTTNTQTTDLSKFRFSAEIAKKFYDFTVRGGVIESSGGVGVNYDHGPIGLAIDAFDFQNSDNDSPHLKLWGKLNLTKNLYLSSGVDDLISETGQRDWFAGAGIQFVDEDIKSLLGAMKLGP